jgi:hypothetical protein
MEDSGLFKQIIRYRHPGGLTSVTWRTDPETEVARLLPEPVEEGESWIVSHQGRYGTHTPGPWKIFDGWGAKWAPLSIVDSIPDVDGKCVANCICHLSSTNDNAEANARLIAAAPEMLEALESLVKTTKDSGLGVFNDEHDALQLAREAIRKAKGPNE